MHKVVLISHAQILHWKAPHWATWKSTNGSQFTSGDWIDVLTDAKIKISMDDKGRWGCALKGRSYAYVQTNAVNIIQADVAVGCGCTQPDDWVKSKIVDFLESR